MKFNKKRYQKLVNELINEGFPLLKNKKIHIWPALPFSKYSASANRDLILGRYLFINNKDNIYDDFEMRGLLSHELSHLESWEKIGLFNKIIEDIKCSFSNEFLAKNERETDRTAIRKGFGKELLKQRSRRYYKTDKNLEKLKKFYLSPEEIKKEMRRGRF